MRKASKILMILGAVFALVTVVSNLITAFAFGTIGVLLGGGLIIGGVASGESSAMTAMISIGLSYGLGFILTAIIIACACIYPLISTILGFIGSRKKAGKVIFILNIVFGVFLAYNFGSGYGLVAAVLLLVGSFLGLSAVKEEKAALAEEEQPVEEPVK